MPQDGEIQNLEAIESEILGEVADAAALKDLDNVRVSALGKKGADLRADAEARGHGA